MQRQSANCVAPTSISIMWMKAWMKATLSLREGAIVRTVEDTYYLRVCLKGTLMFEIFQIRCHRKGQGWDLLGWCVDSRF